MKTLLFAHCERRPRKEDSVLNLHPETLKRFLKHWLPILSRQDVAQSAADDAEGAEKETLLNRL